MGKARTLRSLRMDATENSINAQPDSASDRVAAAFASLIALTSVAGAQARLSTTPAPSYANRADAGPRPIRSGADGRRSVSLRVFSTAMAESDRGAGTPAKQAARAVSPALATNELLLQKLAALESRIKGLEARAESQPRAAGDAHGPIVYLNRVTFNGADEPTDDNAFR